MAIYWMVTGVVKTATGSYDTFFDTTLGSAGYVKGKDHAYIGIQATGHPSQSFWASGSDNNVSDRNAQMYTDFPTGTEVGKLYFLTPEVYNDENLTFPGDKSVWANLEHEIGSGGYFVVTPFDGGFFKYNFATLDDLWNNGWRVSKAGSSDTPLDKTTWDNNKTDSKWASTYGLDISVGGNTSSVKEQIVANMLGASPGSKDVNGGINYFKGAILVAPGGTGGTDWTDYNYIVPIEDSPALLS